MRARRTRLGNDGFSLIESLIALLLLAIVTTALSGVATQSRFATSVAGHTGAATQLGRERLEYLKRFERLGTHNRTDSVWTAPTPGETAVNSTSYSKTLNSIAYTVSSAIVAGLSAEIDQAGNMDRIIPVRVTVSWTEGVRASQVSLTSVFVNQVY